MTYHLRNLGQIATILLHAVDRANAMHADVSAFGAPSECHGLVAAGVKRDWLALVEELEASTGYRAEELVAEFHDRCDGKFLYVTGLLEPLTEMIQHRENEDRIRRRLQYANRARLPGGMSGAQLAMIEQKRTARAARLAA